MCSIPGLPTQGSEVSFLMTRVNLNPSYGLVELWVNIDNGRKHIYRQMREDIQAPDRQFNGSEGKTGDFCLVCISDIWHRARIASIQGEDYNVFLIDQGQNHIASWETLAWGKSESFRLPPEIESCILANVLTLENNPSEQIIAFLKTFCGRNFNGQVQDVLKRDRTILLDIPSVSKEMCGGGFAKKIPVDEFKCLVWKYQEQKLNINCQLHKLDQYFYPELLTNTFENVQVTEVNSPLNIFCKLLIFSKALKILSEQIHQHYEENSDLGETQAQTCGNPCAARGLNGRWHRSLLKQNMTTNGAVEVLHVDEGKTELVPFGDIKPLHEKFLRMPVVTYPCCLDGVNDRGTEWRTDQIDYLKSLLLHRTVLVRFGHHDTFQDVYNVTLYANDATCLNSCFMQKTGLLPPSRTNDQNDPIPASFLLSFRDERCMDVQKKVNINYCLPEETVPRRTDDVPSTGPDDDHVSKGSEPDSPLRINGHLSMAFLSEVRNGCDDPAFTVGSNVHVNVSCIDSLHKFWCQTIESADSLRCLMQDLQNYYSFAHPQPLFESICVARNPDDGMWYRARIVATHPSPVVNVRFIDYGRTQKVPLRDVHAIDPAFLRLNALAFQCCLFSQKNPTNPTAVHWTDSELTDFWRFVALGSSSNVGLTCIIKAVMSDEEGLQLNVVDIETPSDSACELLARSCAQAEAPVQMPPQLPTDAYSYSTYNIDVAGEEKVLVTFSENVNHFYCNLEKNSHLLMKMRENIQQLAGQPHCTDHLFRLNSICLAKYTDNQWYRGKIVEMSRKLKVHFLDNGDTLAVKESDVCPFPSEANIVKRVPVQAILLGLFDVPEDVPQEVNQWFADCAIGHSFTMSVVAKGGNEKLIVQLFDGSINVNEKVRERISQVRWKKKNGLDQQLVNTLKHAAVPDGDCLSQERKNLSVSLNGTEQVHSSNGRCSREEIKTSYVSPGHKREKILDEGEKVTLDVILEENESALAETFIQAVHSDSEGTQLSIQSCLEQNVKTCMYKWPNISLKKTEELYASCIVGPDYFWCQYANTEELNKISHLAQGVGRTQLDKMFSNTLDPGSPCLALFSSDNLWYRAQVMGRLDEAFHVVFIDYGNEDDVDMKNVRPVPQSLLDMPPQAFLCSLNGFDESQGSWDDGVYDVFYNLLVDKPLRVTGFNMKDHVEIAIPQHTVQIQCENIIVNEAMLKYWKRAAKEHGIPENSQTESLLRRDQTVSNTVHPYVSTGNGNIWVFKNPSISIKQKEEVYASCIPEPCFFWCQFANTEELDKVTGLSQEAGQAQLDIMFPKTLGPGSPCLALFSSDNQWYRAQVIERLDNAFHVVFIDYGNESDVDIKNVRALPQSLLDMAPQAFLCSLNGFDESRGSWIEDVYDDFYNLLVNKPLSLTVVNIKDHSENSFPQYSVGIECEGLVVNTAMQKYWKPVAKQCVSIESLQTETSTQDGQTESNMTHFSVSKKDINMGVYKEPSISKNQIEEVYASCIVEPCFFWCQYANAEELDKVSKLSQEAVQTQLDITFPKTLGPGSPCLALFSTDNQWYRALVMERLDDAFHVVFIDYGNETDVAVKNVRPLPESLLDMAPQAFLCSLNGFSDSKGSWDDEVYEDFYSLLVDKPLRLTVCNMTGHSDIAVPQYAVQIECKDAVTCEWLVVNTLMEKHWKRLKSVGSALDPEKCPHENPAVMD